MAASGFSLEAVKNFMIENDCKVTNHELVTHFKSYLNDPIEKCKFLVMNFPLFNYVYFSESLLLFSNCFFIWNRVYGTMLRVKSDIIRLF